MITDLDDVCDAKAWRLKCQWNFSYGTALTTKFISILYMLFSSSTFIKPLWSNNTVALRKELDGFAYRLDGGQHYRQVQSQ